MDTNKTEISNLLFWFVGLIFSGLVKFSQIQSSVQDRENKSEVLTQILVYFPNISFWLKHNEIKN